MKDAKTYYLLKPSALLQKLNIFNCIPFISITISKAWILTYCKLFYNCIFTTPFFNRFTLIFILVPVLQITSLIWIIFKQWKKKITSLSIRKMTSLWQKRMYACPFFAVERICQNIFCNTWPYLKKYYEGHWSLEICNFAENCRKSKLNSYTSREPFWLLDFRRRVFWISNICT